MEKMITNYLKDYFELLSHFIRPEADLNILSILSLYFDEKNSAHQSIVLNDIDVEKLNTDIDDLEIEKADKKLELV